MADVPLAVIRRWMVALAPETPITAPDDRRYVNLDEDGARGDERAVVDRLVRRLDRLAPDAPGCQLLTGFPGTGKTTELHRLRHRLESRPEDPAAVVMIDADRLLDRHTPPTITDLLRVLAWELDREATRREGGDPDSAPGYAARLWRWLQSDLEINNIGFAAFGANLNAEIRDNPPFRERVERVVQLRFQQFAQEAIGVCTEAVNRIRKQADRTRVVVVVDGLEKFAALTGGPERAQEMESAVETLFCTHAAWLRLPAQMVYTFPMWLRFRRTDLGASYGANPLTLPMVKIRTATGEEHEPGIRQLAELVLRRLGDPVALGPAPLESLRPAILACGGYPRDLLRILRESVGESDVFPLTSPTFARVIEQLRQDYERNLLLADVDVLVEIAQTRRLPAGEARLRACQRLFELALVLTYHNAEEWVDVHPLIRRSPRFAALLDG